MKERGLPAYRAAQVFGWLHDKRVEGFEEMTNLSAPLRRSLAGDFYIDAPEVVRRQQSALDGTVKYLLRLQDGECVEAVLMRYDHGNSLCISTQVGCRMGCRFCASTQGGLVRNLGAGEMAGQVYAAVKDCGQRISNVVLMGIGEPLDNYDNVMDFLSIITEDKGYNLSARSVTISTCGLVPAMQKLAGEGRPVTLAVSLHAAFDDKRSAMMPVNNRYTIAEVVAAARQYAETTGRRVSFEYAMVRGVNDGHEDASALAKLLGGMGVHVNLIPVNPVDGSPFGPSDEDNIRRFARWLSDRNINATVRRRLGADISAACGQLRRQAAGEGTP